MSEIGIERGIAGLPQPPVEYIGDVVVAERETNVTVGGGNLTPATGAIVLTTDAFTTDGATVYEIGFCARGLLANSGGGVNLFENDVDLGRIVYSSNGTLSTQRKLRRVPPAGPVIYVARFWRNPPSGTLEADTGNPMYLWVRKIRRLRTP